MVNLLDLTVYYLRRKRVFHIDPTMSLHHILCLISNNFCIKLNEFLLEIIDKRFDLLIALDNSYFDELRSDPYFAVNKSLLAYIRPRHRSSSKIKLDTDYLSTHMLLETATLQNHVIVWLDLHISYVEDYVSLKSYFNSMTAVDGAGFPASENNWDIYNLIMTSYSFKFDECCYKNYTMNILKTFSDSDECLEFVENAAALEKTIFIISSSTLGREIIPKIHDNKYVYAIYILFEFISPLEKWIDYSFDTSKIIIFEHELDLLTRLIRDIATYYEDKSSYNINPQEKLSYLRWARKLYMNAVATDRRRTLFEILHRVEKRIEALECNLNIIERDDGEERCSTECEEIFRCCNERPNYCEEISESFSRKVIFSNCCFMQP